MGMETIDTHEVMCLFHDFMQPASQIRVIRLLGDGNMGKSHLLTKIFPLLAQQQYGARSAILDLRNRLYTIPDILHLASELLSEDPHHFERYYTSHHEWSTRLKVHAQGIHAVVSSVTITSRESADDTEARDRELTSQFVKDLSHLDENVVLLLVDSVNEATEGMQKWLMDKLVVLLSRHAHVRVIIAGRTLPEPHGSYAAQCQSFQLQAIQNEEEYITFCKKSTVTPPEETIRTLVMASGYIPGFFAQLLSEYKKNYYSKSRV